MSYLVAYIRLKSTTKQMKNGSSFTHIIQNPTNQSQFVWLSDI